MIELILKKDIIGLGEEGDVVKVKDGYARNYLIPKKYAIKKTLNNMAVLEKQRAVIEKRKSERRQIDSTLKDKIENTKIDLQRRVHEGTKLYGSVSSKDLVELLAAQGIELNKQNLEMPGPIKLIGDYVINIRLNSGEKASLKLAITAASE
jgi:large subunit ribosomal protein L9